MVRLGFRIQVRPCPFMLEIVCTQYCLLLVVDGREQLSTHHFSITVAKCTSSIKSSSSMKFYHYAVVHWQEYSLTKYLYQMECLVIYSVFCLMIIF